MPNNELVDIFGRRRRHPEKRRDCAARPAAGRRERKMSVRAMIREAKRAGAKVTVAADGSVTLQFGEALPVKQGKANGGTVNEWDRVFNGDDQASIR